MAAYNDTTRGDSEHGKPFDSAPNIGHSSRGCPYLSIHSEVEDQDSNTVDEGRTKADVVRFLLIDVRMHFPGDYENVEDFFPGCDLYEHHSAESKINDLLDNSDAAAHKGNIPTPLRTKGDLARYAWLTVKLEFGYCPVLEARFGHHTHDTTPVNPQKDHENVGLEDLAWIRSFLQSQQERMHTAGEKFYASLSRDPEQNRINTTKNGGFAWIEVTSPVCTPNYGAQMAVAGPAKELYYDSTSDPVVRKMRVVWVADISTGPVAYVMFTVPTSGLDSLHHDDRDKCIEVVHSTDTRAQNSKGVVVVEGANLLLPGSRHFLLATPFDHKWNEPMAELKADQAERVDGNLGGATTGTAMRMSAVGIQELHKFRSGRSASLAGTGLPLRPRYDLDTSADNDYSSLPGRSDAGPSDATSTLQAEKAIPRSRAKRRRLQREDDAKSKKASVAGGSNRG